LEEGVQKSGVAGVRMGKLAARIQDIRLGSGELKSKQAEFEDPFCNS
jgi:hypothetical protein